MYIDMKSVFMSERLCVKIGDLFTHTHTQKKHEEKISQMRFNGIQYGPFHNVIETEK